jgi:hypothetical protein
VQRAGRVRGQYLVGGFQNSGQSVRHPFWGTATRARAEGVGGETKDPGDRPIASGLKCLGHEYNSLHQMALFARGVRWQGARLSPPGLRRFLTAGTLDEGPRMGEEPWNQFRAGYRASDRVGSWNSVSEGAVSVL